MMLTVPLSTQILLIATVLTAFQVFANGIPGYLMLAVLTYAAIRIYGAYSKWCTKLDRPEPKLYDLKAPAVWAQVDEALKTVKSTWKHVTITQDYSSPEPPPGQPIFIQATITVYHPYLASIRQHLSPENQDLRSRIIFKAYIEPKQDQSELRIECDTYPILTRVTENNVIQTILNQIDTLVAKYLPNPKQ